MAPLQRTRPAANRPAHPAPADETSWLLRVRAGNAGAFEEMFSAYYASLCAFTQTYLSRRDIAEDLVENVFLNVWARRATWYPQAGVRAYLFAACYRQAIDFLRHEQLADRVATEAAAAEIPLARSEAPPQPDEALHAAELEHAFRRALADLPERQRMVLVLRWEHELSYAEIAEVLGITQKTIESHVTRSLRSVRAKLAVFRNDR